MVAYVDSEEIIGAINDSNREPSTFKPPILMMELETIRNLLVQNRAITSVVFEDIWNPKIRTRSITIPELRGLFK